MRSDGRMMKGIVHGGAALAFAMIVSSARADAPCGDVDGSGTLTAADCRLLMDVVAGTPDAPAPCAGATSGALQCGDLDADGTVTTADAVICFETVAGAAPAAALCGLTGGGPAPISCPNGTATIASNITRSQVWPASCAIVLDGTIFVQPGIEVVIEPGTVIRGRKTSSNGSPSALIFRRGARITAPGTAGAPIVFTSDQPPGARTKGDWGGLVLNGRAPVNVPGGEGLAEGLSSTPFGGSQPDDSSGTLTYVRVEFAGRQLTVDNELNLVTMNGVGAGTTVDHVQAHVGLDDCHEWFGGTVKEKFLVGTACGDDGLDWQLGYTGSVQYAYVHQNIGIIESGGNGIEADNNENGFDLQPRSDPKFCNLTLVGTRGQPGTPAGTNQLGLLLRRGTAGTVAKAIVAGFHASGMQLQHVTPGCSAGPALTGALLIRDSIFFDNGATGADHCSSGTGSNAPSPCTGCEFYDLLANGFGVVPDLNPQGPVVDPGVSEAWPPSDPRPTNAAAVASGFDCSTLDPFLEATGYVGGFGPGGTNWLEGWTDFALN